MSCSLNHETSAATDGSTLRTTSCGGGGAVGGVSGEAMPSNERRVSGGSG